jgi:WD40 repeat protein
VLNKKNQLISGHVNGLIVVWRLSDMKCIKKIQAHDVDCGIDDMLFIPENKLVTCSKDSRIKLWYLDNGECLLDINNEVDTHCLALTKEFDLVSGDSDARIKIWDMQTGECTALLQAPKTGHNFINTLVVTERNYLLSGDFIGVIKIWDLATLKCIRVIKTQPELAELPGSPDLLFFANGSGNYFCRGISSLTMLNDEEFVSCSYDGKVILWDLNRFELEKRLEGHGKAARCVSFYDFV